MENKDFILSIKDGAIDTMNKYGILASVTIAQAILESGWGKSKLSTEANNLFGIKAHGYSSYVVMQTNEYIRGQKVNVNAMFRKYSSWAESINDHGNFLKENGIYKNILGVKDYKSVCIGLQQAGYATAPNYADSLIRVIEENNLHIYDNYYKYENRANENPIGTSPSIFNLQQYLNIETNAGLLEDGILGPKTQASAEKYLINYGAKGNVVRWVQQKLLYIGYALPKFGADGSYGSEMRAAVISFQKNNGLVADGIIGKKTWTALLNS